MQAFKEDRPGEECLSQGGGGGGFRQIISFELIVTFSFIELILLLCKIIETLDLI